MTFPPVCDAPETLPFRFSKLPWDVAEAMNFDALDDDNRSAAVIVVEEYLVLAYLVERLALNLVVVMPESSGGTLVAVDHELIEPSPHLTRPAETKRSKTVDARPHPQMFPHVRRKVAERADTSNFDAALPRRRDGSQHGIL